MVEYMLSVHRRKKVAIDAYENKRMRRQKKMKDHLEQLYEKRYGTDTWKLRGGLEIPSALLHKVKQEKDRFKVRRHHGLIRILKQGSSSSKKLHHRHRHFEDEDASTTRAGNCKKLAQYCQKEAKRAATKGGRATKDIQLKAKRAQKEMLIFWKKNEKEERELRKKAEREALERLRQEEERREAQRQARKLNFLITQTELYSHFIGRKINKDVTEDEDTMGQQDDLTTMDTNNGHESMDIDITANDGSMEELDFDEDDEEKLKEHARISAQNALAKQRERTKAFDEGAKQRRMDANGDLNMQDQLDTMNFQEPSSMGSGPEVKQPSILMCQLKSYQLKGLNWLANLYDQGINGILADEMGLGKTVQSISLMAYLAEVHNIWGPFLVIAPASTLHNWQQEISKFVPSFKALPYWGNPKERKILRQSWTRKQLYGRDAPFHIVITSYQLVLTDVSYFQRVKWQYMVLDEAQAIKSSSSARWKMLLGFHCRNRLLLTGTPIQNSMQELWALLHFIMPTLFDSHEEFSEWFSKDIESHAENKGTLNEHQLRRLHMILKPFMLRRIKRNVQHELGEKIEVELYCDLTARQKQLYRGLKEKISISELLEKATSLGDVESMDSLMNLVMQFRKVCNHPELFERADVESPFAFCEFGESGPLNKEQYLEYSYSTRNKIKYYLPRQVYRNGGMLKVPGPQSNAGFSTRYLDNLLNIWDSDYIHQSMSSNDQDTAFSFLRFIDTSPHEASYLFKHSLISRWLVHLSQRDQRARRRFYKTEESYSYPDAPINTYAKFLITDTTTPTDPLIITSGSAMDELTHIGDKMIYLNKKFGNNYFPSARSVPIDIVCSDASFEREQHSILFNTNIISSLLGTPQYMDRNEPEEMIALQQVIRKSDGQGIITIPSSGYGYSQMKVPAMRDLILDSGKLARLDKLLEQLKAEGHRCLIYFQMTRMIDLMEEYIAYKQYKYLRLDGSSKISDRRDMVQDWQTRPEIFIFLLSTRAGGLGINLTAADTVIFYDSDWNPTVDQQAMDRAHRLGQTKQVTVYRLLTKNTIEERILMRAKQKDEIQKVVISGGEFKQVDFKPREIVSLLLDDEEMDSKLAQQLKRKAIEEDNNKKDNDERKDSPRPTKRNRKQQSSKESTPAQSPYTVDRLFSAGGDTLPEDEMDSGSSTSRKKSSSTSTDKKGRTGRPRTNFSFTG
ncbi:SNF2 family N-terminal domain-containing protein [Halteromyces radiatus]|uniref:SNF2 family N-terminal domain-containing protein n=1 Tax=Halteromyces radiatus TaxID=101107 RepID=UPI00221F6F06|nr:SNF2 family N-terminal domain-containing protein [Halteromyces radiatus]KAI8092584.1 SNF2 family N-terminal domain-containing protein [Halteromyces radiatus]